MEQWIRATFDVQEDDGQGELFGFTFERNGRTVEARASLSVFLSGFGEVAAPPTNTALVAADPDDTLGWHQYFEAWQAQGIIQA